MTNRFHFFPLRASRLGIAHRRCSTSSRRLPVLTGHSHLLKNSVNAAKHHRFGLRVFINADALAPSSHSICVPNRRVHSQSGNSSTTEVRAREVLKMIEDLDGPAKKMLIDKIAQLPKGPNPSSEKPSQKAAEVEESEPRKEDPVIPLPTLMVLGFMSAIPFIGFGFLDNALMLVAGDLIDQSVSIYLHTSVMASAAMGNVVSGAIGMQVHGIIDRLTQKLFLMKREKSESDDGSADQGNDASNPSVFDLSTLTPEQLNSHKAFIAGHVGGTLGIIIGLCLGMTPLMFISSSKSGSRDDAENE